MKILLTGGTGMVGRNIMANPAISKYEVIAPSRKDLNLLNENEVKDFIALVKPDLIIHAAARVGGIKANIDNPVAFLVENIKINLNVILGAASCGVLRLINIASSCMYPRLSDGVISEEMILTGELEPTNEAYALAKIVGTRLCQYLKKEKMEYEYKTLIPCNLYGPFDNFNIESSHLIAAIIRKVDSAIASQSQEVDIWGDGLARREFLFVKDFVDFIFAAVERYDDLPAVMNVGLGYDHTINEYYEQAAKVLGYKGQFVHDLTKPVGMKRKLTCIKKLNTFGWQAATSLPAGIAETYEYFKKIRSAQNKGA